MKQTGRGLGGNASQASGVLFFFFFLLLTFSFFYCNSYSDYNTMQRHKLNPKKSSSSTRRSGNLAHTWPLTAQCSDRPRGGCMRLDTF
ncbi:hypothetical protein BJV78DRAFT_502572 [Lactifluus subvellereus]|nr:hypothetical protein BJV78DRAFT_502572 [Lactifluus subvellereus]